MTWLFTYLAAAAAAAAAATPTPIQARMAEEIVIAERLVAAITNKREYQDSDFIKPLRVSDKALFAGLSRCVHAALTTYCWPIRRTAMCL